MLQNAKLLKKKKKKKKKEKKLRECFSSKGLNLSRQRDRPTR